MNSKNESENGVFFNSHKLEEKLISYMVENPVEDSEGKDSGNSYHET